MLLRLSKMFFPTGYNDIILMGHEMMSFWRKYVKTFIRQWLWKIGTLKNQNKLQCIGSSFLYIYRKEVKGWPPPEEH